MAASGLAAGAGCDTRGGGRRPRPTQSRARWWPCAERRRRCSGVGTRPMSRRFFGSDGDVHRSRALRARRSADRGSARLHCGQRRRVRPLGRARRGAHAQRCESSRRTCARQRTRRQARARRFRSRMRDVPVRSMRRHADAITASSSPPRCRAPRRARALASAEQREKVCAVLRICSCAMPERRMPRKFFFSLRTGSRARAWMPPALRAAARETAGRVGVLQKNTGISAVFVCVEVSLRVSQRLSSRSRGCRSRRSVRSRHAAPEKKLRRTVDSKKKRD